jgi:hypothetical protein
VLPPHPRPLPIAMGRGERNLTPGSALPTPPPARSTPPPAPPQTWGGENETSPPAPLQSGEGRRAAVRSRAPHPAACAYPTPGPSPIWRGEQGLPHPRPGAEHGGAFANAPYNDAAPHNPPPARRHALRVDTADRRGERGGGLVGERGLSGRRGLSQHLLVTAPRSGAKERAARRTAPVFTLVWSMRLRYPEIGIAFTLAFCWITAYCADAQPTMPA